MAIYCSIIIVTRCCTYKLWCSVMSVKLFLRCFTNTLIVAFDMCKILQHQSPKICWNLRRVTSSDRSGKVVLFVAFYRRIQVTGWWRRQLHTTSTSACSFCLHSRWLDFTRWSLRRRWSMPVVCAGTQDLVQLCWWSRLTKRCSAINSCSSLTNLGRLSRRHLRTRLHALSIRPEHTDVYSSS